MSDIWFIFVLLSIVISTIDANGVRISGPIKLSTKWDFEDFKNRANEKLHSDKKFY